MGFPFELHMGGSVAAVRHRSMSQVHREIFVLVASDFLMLCYQPLRAAGFLERVTKATTAPGYVMRPARERWQRAREGGRRPRRPWSSCRQGPGTSGAPRAPRALQAVGACARRATGTGSP